MRRLFLLAFQSVCDAHGRSLRARGRPLVKAVRSFTRSFGRKGEAVRPQDDA
jgi:hypothetical protein